MSRRASAAAAAAPWPRSRVGNRSIRGQISAPMPIQAPTDDEFPMRQPGVMVGTPSEAAHAAGQLELDSRQQPPRRADDSLFPHSRSVLNDATESEQDDRYAFGDTTSSRRVTPGQSPWMGRESLTDSPTSKEPSPPRSGFKSALRKLFGRKNKKPIVDTTAGSEMETRRPVSMFQPRQETTGEIRLFKTRPANPNQPSMPMTAMAITEYDRALRSHSIGPEDVMAIRSARNSVANEVKVPPRIMLSPDNTATHQAGPRWTEERRFTGLSPRPASSQDRATRLADYSEDPTEIGRAITSDSKRMKRRSRSVSGYPVTGGVSRAPKPDESRQWRESCDLPIMSTSSSSPTDTEADDVSAEEEETVIILQQPPATAVVPFALTDAHEQYVKELPDLPTMHEAGVHEGSRLNGLAARLSRLEEAFETLGSANFLGGTGPPSREPPPIPIAAPALSYSASPVGMGYSPTPTRPSPRDVHPSNRSFDGRSGREDFTNLAATTRDAVGTPSMSNNIDGAVTMEHYATLLALLETERSARQVLESQVRTLSHQINVMAKISGYGSVPSDTTSVARSPGGASAFDHDDDDDDDDDDGDDDDYHSVNGRSHVGLAIDDTGVAAGVIEDDEFADAFMTPTEAEGNYNAFSDENDSSLKSASRTLPLSQLTLGNPPPSTMQQVPAQAM
ncbi:hypothetical protein RJ55_01402 [Drechmeria coniospora]|nr:hypothetical protein RJ55_01402 [Drechmeria coniospora]